MKRIYLLILTILPLCGFAQFDKVKEEIFNDELVKAIFQKDTLIFDLLSEKTDHIISDAQWKIRNQKLMKEWQNIYDRLDSHQRIVEKQHTQNCSNDYLAGNWHRIKKKI